MRLAEQLQRSWKPKPQVRFGTVTSVSTGICTVQVAGGEIPAITLKGAPIAVGDFVAVQRQGVVSYVLVPPSNKWIWVTDAYEHAYGYKTPIGINDLPQVTIVVPASVGPIEPLSGGLVVAGSQGSISLIQNNVLSRTIPISLPSIQPFLGVAVPAGVCVCGLNGAACYAVPSGELLGSTSITNSLWVMNIPGSSDVLVATQTAFVLRLTTPALETVWQATFAGANLNVQVGSPVVNHTGTIAYVPFGTSSASSVAAIDLATGAYTAIASIGTNGSVWYQSDISPDGSTLYFPDIAGSTWAVDTASGSIKWQQAASSSPTGAPSDPSGEYVYSMGSTVDILDPATGAWIGSASYQSTPWYGTVA